MYEARKRAGLTQQKAASAIGVSQSTISEMELQADGTTLLVQFAKLYGCSAEWLATGVEPDPSLGGVGQVAHAVIHRQPIVTPRKIDWEDLVTERIEGQFLMAVKGEALMPTFPPGQMAIWEAGDRANPGQAVLLELPGKRFELRFLEDRGGEWAGVSQRIGFGEIRPGRDGARIVARLRYPDLG